MNEFPMSAANMLMANMNLNGQTERLHKVSGIEGMNTFQTKPSSEYVLFEENSDIFCVKSTDANNTPTCRYFAFKEISKEEALHEISPYMMKDEFNSLKEDIISAVRGEMSSFREEILNGQQFIRNQGSKSVPNAASAIRSESK